jgi:hypothetical protein
VQYGSYKSLIVKNREVLVVKNRNGIDSHARSCPASVSVHKLVLNIHGLKRVKIE